MSALLTTEPVRHVQTSAFHLHAVYQSSACRIDDPDLHSVSDPYSQFQTQRLPFLRFTWLVSSLPS